MNKYKELYERELAASAIALEALESGDNTEAIEVLRHQTAAQETIPAYYIEADPLPDACNNCQEIRRCRESGEGEWCCDECDHLGERFVKKNG